MTNDEEKKKVIPPFPTPDNGVKKPINTVDLQDYTTDIVTEDDKRLYKKSIEPEGRNIIRNGFPGNSHKSREDCKNEPSKLEKVVSGKVIVRKKSLGKKFLETFIGEDSHTIFGYIIHDVLIPAAKDTLYDMVKGSLEMSLFGEKKGSRTRRDNGRSYVSYDRMSSSSSRRDDRDRRDFSNRNRAHHNFDDIIIASRGEAEEVLSNLVDLIIDYNQATVADLYELVGMTANYTDRNYGWTDLSSSSVSRARDGYLLNLPKPILLD